MCNKLQLYLLILDFRENNNPNLFPSKIVRKFPCASCMEHPKP